MSITPVAAIVSYHAHIYFRNAEEHGAAEALRNDIAARFSVQLGRWRETPVGPHQLPMYQVAFAPELFAVFVPWLMLNRHGLTILLHPNTSNPRRDHLVHAVWMGEILSIVRPEQLPELNSNMDDERAIPNTEPVLLP